MKFKIIKSLKREIYKNKKKQFSMEAGFRRMWLMFICLFKTYIFLLLHNHRVKNIIIKPVNSTQNMFIEKISHWPTKAYTLHIYKFIVVDLAHMQRNSLRTAAAHTYKALDRTYMDLIQIFFVYHPWRVRNFILTHSLCILSLSRSHSMSVERSPVIFNSLITFLTHFLLKFQTITLGMCLFKKTLNFFCSSRIICWLYGNRRGRERLTWREGITCGHMLSKK